MKRIAIAAFATLAFASVLEAQQIREMEFKNQAIVDILLALAQASGRSIVPDETVGGTASYYFSETDFDTALKIFLSTYRMYCWKEGNISYVSRVRSTWNKEAGTVTLDAEEVEPRLIVSALSRSIGRTILFDSLPRENITIHVENVKPARILEMVAKRFPDYQVDSAEDFYYLKRLDTAGKPDPRTDKPASWLTLRDGSYSINAEKARLRDLLTEMFKRAGLEFSLFLRSDVILENLHFSDKKLEEMLRLVLDQANADYSIENGIYYVYEIQRADVLKKLKTVHSLPLSYISVQDLPNLLPQDFASQSFLRMDKNTNTVILSGSDQEIGPVEEFIRALDRPMAQKKYYRFDLSYLKVNDFLSLLPSPFSAIKAVALPQGSSFVMLLDPENKRALDDYIGLVDKKQGGIPIQLKYIQSDYLLRNLPPSAAKDEVQATGDSTLVFFNGSEEKLRQFARELVALDRPTPQIRYELLVIEYQDGESLDWSVSAANGARTDSAGSTAFYGTIGKLLKLNFNIVTTFGTLFAVNLDLALTANKAKVLADTTVNGLSGQEIKFQNTLTTRYRDWVSGDGMITMKVSSTVSKQGSDMSATAAGNPPSTSEKIVSTNVRTVTGKPVVIGGLIQQEKNVTVQKTPVLGDIPLLGLLFQSRNETISNDEFVIYIVPHVEYPEHGAADEGVRMEALYKRFVKEQ
ncbi:MAG: secretin N-terminal domain-containing protein [Spirochaetia bacterium]